MSISAPGEGFDKDISFSAECSKVCLSVHCPDVDLFVNLQLLKELSLVSTEECSSLGVQQHASKSHFLLRSFSIKIVVGFPSARDLSSPGS